MRVLHKVPNLCVPVKPPLSTGKLWALITAISAYNHSQKQAMTDYGT